ncbi:hypothetical protein [Cellulophaga sp. L1A9]|uniref:hypothetical protein n=1 Tax=Cellulophaga sp. L1A9 TaxID=2686362 RepID=UPI00131C5259|nr:hypothetical protein [Cellulophaga sp. L1A9]
MFSTSTSKKVKSQDTPTIDKQPLRVSDGNTHYIEEQGVAYLKPTIGIKILILCFKLLLLGVWGVLFYDLFIEDLKMSNSFWFYVIYICISLLLSITFLFAYTDHSTKRYFNKNNGKFKLSSIDFSRKEKKIKKIIGIQIIGYQKHQKVPSGASGSIKGLFTYFQLNVVMKNYKRYTIATFKKRENVMEVAQKLSVFLTKPIFNEIEKFEGIDEETERLSNNFHSRLILQDDFEIKMTKDEFLERLIHHKHYEIIQVNKSSLTIDSTPLNLFNFSLGKFINQGLFKPYIAYVELEQKNHVIKVTMKTKFRYEFLLYISVFLILLLCNFYGVAMIVIMSTLLFWSFQRGDEKVFFQLIKKDALVEDKTSNIME